MKGLKFRNLVQWLPTKNCLKSKEKSKSHHLVLGHRHPGVDEQVALFISRCRKCPMFSHSHTKGSIGP